MKKELSKTIEIESLGYDTVKNILEYTECSYIHKKMLDLIIVTTKQG